MKQPDGSKYLEWMCTNTLCSCRTRISMDDPALRGRLWEDNPGFLQCPWCAQQMAIHQ